MIRLRKNLLMLSKRFHKISLSLFFYSIDMAIKIGKDMEFDTINGKIVKKVAPAVVYQGKPLAVIYCRVSTDGQVTEGHGIGSQEEACKNRCNNNDVEYVRVFKDEGISGTDLKRQGIHQAIEFLNKENTKYTKIKYFVCTETSRISRSEDLMATLGLEKSIKGTGVEIIYAFNPVMIENDETLFTNKMNHVISWYERMKISKRCKN